MISFFLLFEHFEVMLKQKKLPLLYITKAPKSFFGTITFYFIKSFRFLESYLPLALALFKKSNYTFLTSKIRFFFFKGQPSILKIVLILKKKTHWIFLFFYLFL